MKKKKKRRTSLILVMTIIGLFLCTLVIQGVNLRADCKALQQQQTELKAQKKQLQKEKKAIKEKSEYMETDQYIEDTAREKFGLIYDDEIIFKPEEETAE
ncbi:MAG: septum formation initiator family protein [Eubacterium sp.]|nr:septum formation initiator family protein [Eubacterium sp.]